MSQVLRVNSLLYIRLAYNFWESSGELEGEVRQGGGAFCFSVSDNWHPQSEVNVQFLILTAGQGILYRSKTLDSHQSGSNKSDIKYTIGEFIPAFIAKILINMGFGDH